MNTSKIISVIRSCDAEGFLLTEFARIHPCFPVRWEQQPTFFTRREFYETVAGIIERYLVGAKTSSEGHEPLLDLWLSLHKSILNHPVLEARDAGR